MTIDTLLVDFDGVLRRWADDDDATEDAHGLPRGAIRRAAFEPASLAAAVTGAIDDDAWRADIARRLRGAHGASADAAIRQWSTSPGAIDADVLALLRRTTLAHRLVLVTNATTRLPRDLDALGLAGAFHRVVNSSAIGTAKPSGAFFRAALDAAGTSAARALLVDDSPANVAAGAALGIAAHAYVDVAGLDAFLRDRGVLRDGFRSSGG